MVQMLMKKPLANTKKFSNRTKNEIEYPEILAFIENNFQKQIKEAINQMAKSERASELNKIAKEIFKS